jgi:hypothetical protein
MPRLNKIVACIAIFGLGLAVGIKLMQYSIDLGPQQDITDVVHRYNICKAEAPKGSDCFMLPLTVPLQDMRGIVQ